MAKPLAVFALILSVAAALVGGITLAAQQSGGGGPAAGQTSTVDLNVQQGGDPCGHDPFIFGQNSHNMTVKITVTPATGQINISGPQPWVKVNGTYNSGTGQISAQGSGTVAGYPNTYVTFTGTYANGQLTGKYTFGNTNPPGQGGLPPCGPAPAQPHPAVYTVKAKPPTPTATQTPRTPGSTASPTATTHITPTGTPPKLYSIIAIKLNDDTLAPIPDWTMALYTGNGCTGGPIHSQATDLHGMTDFLGLMPGTYSVKEGSRPGWNPAGDTCRNTTVPSAAGAGVPACPISPDLPFPQPGCDSFASAARVIVRFNGTGLQIGADLGGPVQIERLNSPADHNANGLDDIQTEMVFMHLTGGGITVRESPTRHSTGLIEEQHNITPNHMDFPADSFFDVFFEVDVNGTTLHNEVPFHIQCKITQIPPYLCFYEPPITTPIELLDANGVKVAKLIHGLHLPVPPNESVIIFTNRPKLTPTVTPTGTPTPTPHGPTATPTNPAPNGACNKTGQNVTYQNKTWDQWKCMPNNPVPFVFNRIDIFVGSAQANPILSVAHFVCQHTMQKVEGVFKVHKPNVFPGTTLPNADIWSGQFDPKCDGGVTVYVQPVSAAVHPNILQVAFTDNQTPTVTATPLQDTPTPTPRPHNGDANKDGVTNAIDAALVLQFDGGLTASINDAADVNNDGHKDSRDALLILQFVAGLLNHLPV
jgi:hypothetical protein